MESSAASSTIKRFRERIHSGFVHRAVSQEQLVQEQIQGLVSRRLLMLKCPECRRHRPLVTISEHCGANIGGDVNLGVVCPVHGVFVYGELVKEVCSAQGL